ncbi:hypothetical protein VIBNISO65_110076 [Vibrio nigripulchritudo SO65]|nr:hypothetical protein VIBNIPon4_530203 [Vibrio nigripulchritudo POn4]CCN74505.1 hypothetical protein VIBNISO65_110076 [Vibrio nigripulchritudo SO65]
MIARVQSRIRQDTDRKNLAFIQSFFFGALFPLSNCRILVGIFALKYPMQWLMRDIGSQDKYSFHESIAFSKHLNLLPFTPPH